MVAHIASKLGVDRDIAVDINQLPRDLPLCDSWRFQTGIQIICPSADPDLAEIYTDELSTAEDLNGLLTVGLGNGLKTLDRLFTSLL